MLKVQFEEVTKWQEETFGKNQTLPKIYHLQEEIEELKIALVSNNEKEIEKEFADCFILLFGSAKSHGLSFEDISRIVDEKMKINKLRSWGKPDENGVVNHVK